MVKGDVMMAKWASNFLAPILAVALLAACGSGEGGGGPAPTGTELAPTLASIQDNVFTPSCIISGCHGGLAVGAELRLEPGTSAENLILVPSSQNSDFIRVIPFDPDNSLLIRKLEDDIPPVGQRMRLGGPFLPQETIDVIRQWILDGAPEL